MFEIFLTLRHNRRNEPVLAVSPLVRIAFGLIALIITLAMVLQAEATILGVILTGIALLGAAYEESWRCDSQSQAFEQRTGLIFLFRRRTHPWEQCRSLRLESESNLPRELERRELEKPQAFGGGLYRKTNVALYLDFKEGGELVMERHRQRRKEGLGEAARAFAKASSLPLQNRMVD